MSDNLTLDAGSGGLENGRCGFRACIRDIYFVHTRRYEETGYIPYRGGNSNYMYTQARNRNV